MQSRNGTTLFSASDLVNFMGCTHATALDLRQLSSPVEIPDDDDQARLLQEKGMEHERAYLARLKAEGLSVVEIDGEGDVAAKAERTRAALREGPDVIYQGAFLDGPWQGYSDFLLKVPGKSALGDYHYEVADTKLSRSAKPKHILQMCVYCDILAREQGIAPAKMHVVLGDGSIVVVRVDAVIHYFAFARQRFLEFAASEPQESLGTPCGHCTFCRWAPACDAEWDANNHLSLVASLNRSQAETLRAEGMPDLIALSVLPTNIQIPGIQSETLIRLREQARLQAHFRATGERTFELLESDSGRGLSRLPVPSDGDMFFDMEGDPLFEGGLEYLFGIITVDEWQG